MFNLYRLDMFMFKPGNLLLHSSVAQVVKQSNCYVRIFNTRGKGKALGSSPGGWKLTG